MYKCCHFLEQCQVLVSDGQPGADEKTATSTVQITVIRVQAPQWVPNQLIYRFNMREDDPNNTVVIDLEATKTDVRVCNFHRPAKFFVNSYVLSNLILIFHFYFS